MLSIFATLLIEIHVLQRFLEERLFTSELSHTNYHHVACQIAVF